MTENAADRPQPIWLIPLVVATALFMENMDSSAIGTALPAIARDLKEDPVILKLALTSYLLSLAIFIPISGWCADRFGARPVFQTAIAVFIVSSVACGSAGSLWHLIIARALQGVGGAMMVPVGRLIVLRAVPKAQLVSALAYLSIPALIGPMVGPLLGGFITTYFDWRWIFWINVPVGLLGITLANLFMPNVRGDADDKLDWLGFALAGVGVSTMIFGFTVAGRDFLPSPGPYLLMLFGAVVSIAYVWRARQITNPVLDLRLLKVPTFQTSIIGGGVFRLGMGAVPFLLPLMLQIGFGLNPLQSGMITFASALGALLMKTTASPILRRYGFRTVLTGNALICSVILALYGTLTAALPHVLIIAFLIIAGFFRSLQFTSLNAVAYADIDNKTMSRATALVAVAQQLFLSAGVAIAALLLELSRSLRGASAHELLAADFSFAFFVVASLGVIAALFHSRLPADAGATVSGHKSD
jgi:EmrB/QacA subfamily drug resistance transporter